MLRALLWVTQALIAALAIYNLAVALAGWGHPRLSPPGGRQQRFRIVVPAHNEEPVIAAVVGDLRSSDYPPARYEVSVLADRCTDRTADLARTAGATVIERTGGDDGKGAALAWYLGQRPLAADEALVVIDADNRIPRDMLGRLADEIEAGSSVLQAYLDVANPDSSVLATASALSYWASNRMVQLARTRLGWSADLGGTGMCLTARALEDAGGFGRSLTEDQELGARLLLAGHPVKWLHDVKVADEKPNTGSVASAQRARWITGRRQVARKWFVKLLRSGSAASLDLALRLVQPSRMGIALVSALLAVLAGLGVPLWPWGVWAGLAALQVLAPIAFLLRDRIPARYLSRYPVLIVLPVIKLIARFVPTRDWYHTPHHGEV
jgi:cellulose synthase/poly-beta-1,6-N-acetylglucosamine synthase-like glycosyltransferase